MTNIFTGKLFHCSHLCYCGGAGGWLGRSLGFCVLPANPMMAGRRGSC